MYVRSGNNLSITTIAQGKETVGSGCYTEMLATTVHVAYAKHVRAVNKYLNEFGFLSTVLRR